MEVTAPDGFYSLVEGIFPQGVLPVHRVTFSDGSVVEASEDHLWTATRLKGDGQRHPVKMTTAEMRDAPKWWHVALPNPSGLSETDIVSTLDRPLCDN